MKQSLYEIIGVSPSATKEEIESACLKLGEKLNAEKNDGKLASAIHFQQVEEAYEILTNPQKRAKYDKESEESLKSNIVSNINEKNLAQSPKPQDKDAAMAFIWAAIGTGLLVYIGQKVEFLNLPWWGYIIIFILVLGGTTKEMEKARAIKNMAYGAETDKRIGDVGGKVNVGGGLTAFFEKVARGDATKKELFFIRVVIVLVFVTPLLYWLFNSDRQEVTVNGKTVTLGVCKSDLKALEQLEKTSSRIHPSVADLVKTEIPDGKVGPCGGNALSALKNYFYHRDDVENLNRTMSGVMTSIDISKATETARKARDDARNAYNIEKEKLKNLEK